MERHKDTLNTIDLSKEQWQQALDCLKELLKVVLAGMPKYQEQGICTNWFHTMEMNALSPAVAVQAYKIITLVGMRWKHSTRPDEKAVYMVPMVPIDGVKSRANTWVGGNRDLRIDLMRYTIKRMRDKIRRMK